MNCFLCNTEMKFYFKKLNGNDFWQYVRCDKCGIVLNETVYKMTDEEWKKLNEYQHKDYQQTDENIVDPNWISRLRTQTEVICQMYKNKIFEVTMKAVDYGCGDGKFSDYLQEKYYEKNSKNLFLINKYDEYMQPINSEGVLSKTEIKKYFRFSCNLFCI